MSNHQRESRARHVLCVLTLTAAVLAAGVSGIEAQQTCQARMEQDPALDNLVHPEGYRTAEPGTLGGVIRRGEGPVDMVLVAGAGFGAEVFEGFMQANAALFRGAAGEPGQAGASAYEVAVANGFQGTEPAWLASLRGGDGSSVNEDALVERVVHEVLKRIQAPVESEHGISHLVLVAPSDGAYWLRLQPTYLNAQSYYSHIRHAEPPDYSVGELPQLVAYEAGKPVRSWKGLRDVELVLTRISRGEFDFVLN